MKPILALAKSALWIVLLAVLAAACGVPTPLPTPPKETSNAPTRVVTLPAVPSALPKTGGEPIKVDPVGEAPPPAAPTEPPPVVAAPFAPCGGPFGCARLGITQAGQASQVEWTNQGIVAVAKPSILPSEQSRESRWVIDTGSASPDGRWLAFTSIGYESGGPVFLQKLETGAWTNVIETMNLMLPEGRDPLPEDLMWDVIGWFPDSQRLMIGPYDLSFVAVVDLSTFSARILPFPGGGKGGRAYVNLAADGSHFVYIGESASGAQTLSVYNLTSGDSTVLQEVPYAQGILSTPRLSPDAKSLVYLRQQSDTSTGTSGEINLLSLETGVINALAKGSLWMAVPAWSPDGRSLAFTLAEEDSAARAAKNTSRAPVRGNVWVVSVADGSQAQITFVDGVARSPAWSPDGKSLAFVTHDGQVGLASLDQPGQIWQAAGPSPLAPELTSVYFVP